MLFCGAIAASSFRKRILLNRSHTTRTNRAWAWLSGLALALGSACGCQSNSQTDLLARDRRMEEDQLYAMQDYIAQYQQLVCKYRSENASLRRRLAEEQNNYRRDNQPQPQPSTREPNWSTTSGPPKTETGPTPAPLKQPAQPTTPTPGAPNMEPPDVPPLGTHSSDAGDHESSPASQEKVADYEEPVANGNSTDELPTTDAPAEQANSELARQTTASAWQDVLLSGRVVSNPHGGPRLAIELSPRADVGTSTMFDGSVSLLLVSVQPDGRREKLARWDFGAGDVQAAADPKAKNSTLHFHVELPADTKVDSPVELMARLTTAGGDKLLTYANVDLTRPGGFTSGPNRIWPGEQSVVAASYEEPANEATRSAESAPPAPLNEGRWVVAAPGQPANLPPEANGMTGGWRPASGPIPTTIANASPANQSCILQSPTQTSDRRVSQSVDSAAKSANEMPTEVASRPSWSPERRGTQSQVVRPVWSPTR